MKRTFFVLVVILLFLLPLSAFAQDRANYITAKAGGFFPTGDLDDMDLANGFFGELTIGHYYNPNVALELGAGFLISDSDTFSAELDRVWAVPVTLTVKGIVPVNNFELFAGLGGGVYYTQADLNPSTGNTISDEDWLAGGHVLLGFNYNVSQVVFFGIEGRYLFTSEAQYDDIKANLTGFTLTGNIGVRLPSP
jgi:outer membrane protein W